MLNNKKMRYSKITLFVVLLLKLSFPIGDASAGESDIHSLSIDWGGRIKAVGKQFYPDSDSVYADIDKGPYNEGSMDGRLTLAAFSGAGAQLDVHYESVYIKGDLQKIRNNLTNVSSETNPLGTMLGNHVDDDRRLMDLTRTIHEDDRSYAYHRLDRLALTLTPSWGTLRIGRQALTWGNGMVFNPMDVFNPFSPTDVDRDYKTGDDMVTTTWLTASGGELQLVGVVRRDTVDADVNADSTSIAGKYHGTSHGFEYDIMGARHYEDYIIGGGISGYLLDAAWRMDTTYTFLRQDRPGRSGRSDRSDSGFWSIVVNLDYAWGWWNKNWYGLVEFYFNTLGDNDPLDALNNPDLTERLDRGEIYTLGTAYLGTSIQVELHPLVNFHMAAITNLNDPSGVIQPRITWDVISNFQITLGANGYWGKHSTEFGGFSVPFVEGRITPLDHSYVWLTYFF